METKELLRIVKGFRLGMLGAGTPTDMCFILCAPLQAYLSTIGIETELICVSRNGFGHHYLVMSDGNVIDPSADQFGSYPDVYIGPPLSIHKKHKASPPVSKAGGLACVALLVLAGVQSSSSLPSSSSPAPRIDRTYSVQSMMYTSHASTVPPSAMLGGGSGGGEEPLPFSSAMDQEVRVAQDSPACDALQFEVMRHVPLVYEDTAHADTMLLLIDANESLIKVSCKPATRRWFFQPYTMALFELGRYEAILGVLRPLGDLGSRLMEKKAHALLRLRRYREAEPFFQKADSLYSQREDRIDRTLAIMRVNHAWNLYYLSRYREARRLIERSRSVLLEACCDAATMASITEMERLTGKMAGLGLEKQPEEEAATLWSVPGLLMGLVGFVLCVLLIGFPLAYTAAAARRRAARASQAAALFRSIEVDTLPKSKQASALPRTISGTCDDDRDVTDF